MKTLRMITYLVAVLALALAGCTPDDPTSPTLTVAQPMGVDALTRYVAIGNSLTAGYMDNGLSVVGQLSSYPAQIAPQLGLNPAPGAADWFAQPLINLPGVGESEASSPANVAGVLHWNGAAISVLDETPLLELESSLLAASSYPTPYNNLGVPGATTLDVSEAIDATTSQRPGNVFFDLVLRNPTFGDVAMLDQAIAQGPTLVTIWIGANDVLGGATSGSPEVGVNVTPPAAYEGLMSALISELVDGVEARFGYTPHLVVANIPSITTIPYFVPKALFDQIATGGMGSYPADEADVVYVRFPVLGELAEMGGAPLSEDQTLSTAEVDAVETAVAGYNAALETLSTTFGFTVVDVASTLASLDPSQLTHFQFLVGQGLTPEQAAATTLFSLDGVHPNSTGYSLIANDFIAGINEQLGLTGEAALDLVAAVPWDPTYSMYSGKSAALTMALR